MSTTTSGQRIDEWETFDAAAMAYHFGQWSSPKESTLALAHFVADRIAGADQVIDMACGAGAATAHLAAQHPATRFVGLDLSARLVNAANAYAAQRGLANLGFEQADWYELAPRTGVDGVVSLQTLSWLPDFRAPLAALFERCQPRWIALSSLFYPGEISTRTEITEHLNGKSSFYNVYAVPEVARFCAGHGYAVTRDAPFEIGIDLARPASPDYMGTYTVQAQEAGGVAGRLQISGPLLMNWRFLLIERQVSD